MPTVTLDPQPNILMRSCTSWRRQECGWVVVYEPVIIVMIIVC